MTIQIKPITETHISSFQQAITSVAAERRYLLTIEEPPLEKVEAAVHSYLESGSIYRIAVDDSETVVGWCCAARRDLEGVQHVATIGMGVISKLRGQGLGKLLLAETVEACFESDVERVELDVFSNNRVALALYQKAGFQIEGTKRHARYLDGEWTDLIVMSLLRDEYESLSSTQQGRPT